MSALGQKQTCAAHKPMSAKGAYWLEVTRCARSFKTYN
jgi:hypothetical protein